MTYHNPRHRQLLAYFKQLAAAARSKK